MLTREHRITAPSDFQRAFKGTKTNRSVRVNTGSVMLRVVNRHDNDVTRFGFIVTKRYGNAVARNAVKRRMRAAADEVIALYPTGFDIVAMPTEASVTVAFTDLVVDMVAGVRRATRFLR